MPIKNISKTKTKKKVSSITSARTKTKYEKHGTYSDNDHIYSVDLMFMYINNKKPKSIKLDVHHLIHHLSENDWSDWSTPGNEHFSAIDVINNPLKYKEHYNRITKAELKYPIIIDKKTGYIVDGMHRLAKTHLLKKSHIKAFIFDDDLMKKFIITTRRGKEWSGSDWQYYDSLTKKDLDKLYDERF